MKNYANIEEIPSLFSLIQFKHIEKIKLVLEKNPQFVNEYNSYDGSALHAAIYKGNLAIVQLLLEYGADIYRENYNCENCVEYAKTHATINSETQSIYELILSIDEQKQLEHNLQSTSFETKKIKL